MLTAFFLCGCRAPLSEEPRSGSWTLSEMENRLAGPDPIEPFNRATFAVQHVLMEYPIDWIGRVYTSILPRPVITAINNNTSTDTNTMFVEVFTLAQEVSKETGGAFDITVAPLVNLWGFGFKNMDNVSQEKVDSLLPFVGYQKVKLVDGKIQKEHPETMLDCSAIAKGYGVDAVGKYLETQGISNYMVEIGGEVRVRGFNPRGELWHVGINKPNDDPASINNDIEQVIQITQLAMYEGDGGTLK